ncbi:MAG: hypothetical protein ACI8S6_005994, partial [Myxococcota bacterium]
MQITRRHLFALSAATAAAAGLCGGGVALRWWDQPSGDSYTQLSDSEASFIRSLSEAAFPGGDFISLGGGDAQLDAFFDVLIEGMEPLTANLLKLLTQALERATLLTDGAHFTSL